MSRQTFDYCDIKHALCKKGYNLTRIAKELELSGPQMIQQVCTRKCYSERIERYISQVTGIPVHKLFPDRYDEP